MSDLHIIIPGEMRGKGRPRFGNGRTFTDEKTQTAEAIVRLSAMSQVGTPVLTGPLRLSIVLDMQIPSSWSKRKQAEALAHTVRPTCRPDLDNITKLICDALNGIVWKDDAQVCELRVTRRYAPRAQTDIWVGAA